MCRRTKRKRRRPTARKTALFQNMIQRTWPHVQNIRPSRIGRVALGDQFHPREFSAITGAEICAVRALRPLLLPLPRLPWLSRPPRPPVMKGPPFIEP